MRWWIICRRRWTSGPVSGIHPKTEKTKKRKPDPNEPFAALAFKIMTDPYVGKLTFFRVYSGTLGSGDDGAERDHRQAGTNFAAAADVRPTSAKTSAKCAAGDIAATVALKEVRTGDTLCVENKPILLEKMEFPTPVIEIAIEPKSKADQDKIAEALSRLGR